VQDVAAGLPYDWHREPKCYPVAACVTAPDDAAAVAGAALCASYALALHWYTHVSSPGACISDS